MSNRLIVEADGGSRGNPGPAGYGALVRDAATGAVLAERAQAIGRATNNVAEYRGLIAGLQACVELDPAAAVEVRMDSKLVVEQMSGRWKVKHPDMQPLASQAAALVRQLGQVRFTWIPRESNRDADRLANLAMDGNPVSTDNQLKGFADGPAGSAVAEPTTFIWARHGQTAQTVAKLFSGVSDPELTQVGREQAVALAGRLEREGIDLIVSSPLRRAQQTAAPVADRLGYEVQIDARLREIDFGRWEGLSFKEVRQTDAAHMSNWLQDPSVAPPGGESFTQAEVRVRSLVSDLLASHAGQTIALVSHVTPIKTALRFALNAAPEIMHRLHVDLCSVSVCQSWSDGYTVMTAANDHAHVPGLSD